MQGANAVCVLLCAAAVALELLVLYVIVSAGARAQRQADAVVAAVKLAPAIELHLQPQPLYRFNHRDNRSKSNDYNDEEGGVVVTGTLVPALAEDTGRLRFDGRLHVRHNVTPPSPPASSSSSSSTTPWSWDEALDTGGEQHETMVIRQQRGVRFASLSETDEGQQDDTEAECLLPTDDVPPLFTVEMAAQTAFAAQSFADFGAHCKRGRPLEVVFHRSPFVLCVLDWFDALNECGGHDTSPTSSLKTLFPTPDTAESKAEAVATPTECSRAPPLVIFGERVVLEATLVFTPTEVEKSVEEARVATHCPLLEAPMATVSLDSLGLLSSLLPRPTLETTANVSNVAQLSPLV